jgi:orotate phosphoribosyltransferase-like protein
MGYRGKLDERRQARRLRQAGLPLAEIAARLGVSKSSVSLWVRDPSIRRAKHVHGCVSIGYSCSATHRSVMGLVSALLCDGAIPG